MNEYLDNKSENSLLNAINKVFYFNNTKGWIIKYIQKKWNVWYVSKYFNLPKIFGEKEKDTLIYQLKEYSERINNLEKELNEKNSIIITKDVQYLQL